MPTTSTTVADSQGTTFNFNGVDFVAKNLKVKTSKGIFDTTPLSASGGVRTYQGSTLQDIEISCEYWGSTQPATGTRAAITSSMAGISGYAICETFELTAAVGELIVGNMTLKISTQ
jgi:hypothetical protein